MSNFWTCSSQLTRTRVTEDEFIERVRKGQGKLLFDTNALFGHRRLIALCDAVTRLNDRLAAISGPPLNLLVSAAAHAEKLFDLKQAYDASYSPAQILQGMQRKGLAVLSFETAHAEAMAVLIGKQYPTREEWRQAKKQRCLHCLGIKELAENPGPCSQCGRPGTAPGSGKTCGATIDWLIAAHAVAEGCILVTDDRGVEYKLVQHKIRLTSLERAITRILEEVSG
jgi:hypothetical protein